MRCDHVSRASDITISVTIPSNPRTQNIGLHQFRSTRYSSDGSIIDASVGAVVRVSGLRPESGPDMHCMCVCMSHICHVASLFFVLVRWRLWGRGGLAGSLSKDNGSGKRMNGGGIGYGWEDGRERERKR